MLQRMTGISDQIMAAITKSVSLRELYIGENPWTDKDWTNILKSFQNPTELNTLGLGSHTYLSVECVQVMKQ